MPPVAGQQDAAGKAGAKNSAPGKEGAEMLRYGRAALQGMQGRGCSGGYRKMGPNGQHKMLQEGTEPWRGCCSSAIHEAHITRPAAPVFSVWAPINADSLRTPECEKWHGATMQSEGCLLSQLSPVTSETNRSSLKEQKAGASLLPFSSILDWGAAAEHCTPSATSVPPYCE